MQADRQHLRARRRPRRRARRSVLEIGVELVAGVEALRRRKSHVVAVERIGHDQLRLTRGPRPSTAGRRRRCRRCRGSRPPRHETVRIGRERPWYQPSGRAPVTSAWISIASAICSRSTSGDVSGSRSSVKPWVAISHPASFIAGDSLGVARHRHRDGIDGDRNRALGEKCGAAARSRRESRIRRCDSMFMWRMPGQGAAPTISDKKASAAASPWRTRSRRLPRS